MKACKTNGDARPEKNGCCTRYGRVCPNAILGHVAFNADEWRQVNMKGSLPTVQASHVGIKRITSEAAVAEERVIVGTPRYYGRSEKRHGAKHQKEDAQR